MFDNSYRFEPTVTLNGIPILPYGCQASTKQGKAEVSVAVTHLASARSQKVRTGILGMILPGMKRLCGRSKLVKYLQMIKAAITAAFLCNRIMVSKGVSENSNRYITERAQAVNREEILEVLISRQGTKRAAHCEK